MNFKNLTVFHIYDKKHIYTHYMNLDDNMSILLNDSIKDIYSPNYDINMNTFPSTKAKDYDVNTFFYIK
jgi:hypothetical protein